MKRLVSKILLKINSFNQKQWLVVSIITTTIGLWFPFILHYWGNKLHLTQVNENGEISFTLVGLLLTLLAIGWTFVSLIAQRYYDYINRNHSISEENLGNAETLYGTLNECSTAIIEKVVLEKLDYIECLLKGNRSKVLSPINEPEKVLNNVIHGMSDVLTKLLSYKQNNVRAKDLFINIYYCFPYEDDNKWYRSQNSKQEKGLRIDELLHPNTSFFEALYSQNRFVYYNSKKDAKEANHYLPDGEDDSKLNGSIACYLYSVVNNEKEYIRFMITVASYGKRFSKSDSKEENSNIAWNLRRCVFPEFEMLIKSALSDLYILHLLEKTTTNP